MNWGAPDWIRTSDNQIRSQVLYPLSYGRIALILYQYAPYPVKRFSGRSAGERIRANARLCENFHTGGHTAVFGEKWGGYAPANGPSLDQPCPSQ
jgi:hypothetical protein